MLPPSFVSLGLRIQFPPSKARFQFSYPCCNEALRCVHIVLCTNVEDLAQAARDFSTAGALRTTAIFCQQMYEKRESTSSDGRDAPGFGSNSRI